MRDVLAGISNGGEEETGKGGRREGRKAVGGIDWNGGMWNGGGRIVQGRHFGLRRKGNDK